MLSAAITVLVSTLLGLFAFVWWLGRKLPALPAAAEKCTQLITLVTAKTRAEYKTRCRLHEGHRGPHYFRWSNGGIMPDGETYLANENDEPIDPCLRDFDRRMKQKAREKDASGAN